MSIHGQLMRLSSIISSHSRNPEIPQHFDFDLNSDVIGDLEAKFRMAVSEFIYGHYIRRLNFENPSVTFRDIRGGGGESDGWKGPSIPQRGAG